MSGMGEISPILLALIAAAGGGLGLEIIRRLYPPAERRLDEAAAIRGEASAFRAEQRTDLAGLRTEVARCAAAVDEWQAKYYAVVNEMHQVRAELERVKAELAALHAADQKRRAGRRTTDAMAPPTPRVDPETGA